MKKKGNKARRQPIEAAGGIILRGRVRPLFAVVQLRSQKTWVLPKGKLNRGETALAAARREAIEETGHDVEVHEFLGSLAYKTVGRLKTVRFWRMQASPRPVARLMRDVRAVRWLSLAQAIARLTHEREKLFLEKIGRQVIRQTGSSRRSTPKSASRVAKKTKSARKRAIASSDGRRAAHPAAGGHARRENRPALKAASAEPVQIQLVGRRPPAAIQKLWTLLRR